jgi:hypothetical protein
MNKQKWILLVAALALIGAAAGLLSDLRAKQKLGQPAVKTVTQPDTQRLQVVLPERVLDYSSEALEVAKVVLDTLPPDTSFGQRRYTAADGFITDINVVLMGLDRTSLHKPEICLEGQGWHVVPANCGTSTVHIERPCAYELPVMKLVVSKTVTENGQTIPLSGIFVYWFVAPDELTAHHWQRMWWMAKDMLRAGVLQRWAYVSCFHVCPVGQEEACFERMKKLIAASVPEFQLTPGPAATVARAPGPP